MYKRQVHAFAGDLQPGIVALPVSGLGHEVDGFAPAHGHMIFRQHGDVYKRQMLHHAAQILHVQKQQTRVVGNAEDQMEHPALHLSLIHI